ncbi:MAG: hypothetical protein QOI80_2026 [Solirubrobacteraceae bacterium]|nr:hypothetical protein [Solirubrobacteraceae bacterium]
MRRLVILAALMVVSAAPARAATSSNVTPVAHLADLPTAISANFIGDTMFVSTVSGVYAYDVADPTQPKRLGALPMYIYENEDVDVDPVRKRLFISRDPRGFTSPAVPGDTFPYGAVHIIDVADPANMRQLNVFTLPAGHTTTCVNHCDTIWTAGPYANAQTNPGLVGRPIYATDVRDPANPAPCPKPIDIDHDDGKSGYVHDVQVDARGIAWVSGQGGVRGYWTRGRHRNPVTHVVETATGCDPVPYAGAGTPAEATPSRFMHNAWRDYKPMTRKRARRLRKRGKVPRNDVLLGTEENVVTDCPTAGRFATYDLRGTKHGQGFGPATSPTGRLKPLDTWTPEQEEGSTGCASSHYFASRGDGLTVNAFYTQGVRFLDTSDPRHIRQVGYFVNPDSDTWAAYWHDGYVFVTDFQRGVDVLRFAGSARRARRVTAPSVHSTAPRLTFDRGVYGGLCPLLTS